MRSKTKRTKTQEPNKFQTANCKQQTAFGGQQSAFSEQMTIAKEKCVQRRRLPSSAGKWNAGQNALLV